MRIFFTFLITMVSLDMKAENLNKVLESMDSRIIVDGKHICFSYADLNAKNRCEAISKCEEVGAADLNDKFNKTPETDLKGKLFLKRRLANLYAYKEKNLTRSLDEYKNAYQIAEKVSPDAALDVLAEIGLVQMRLAEIKNCVNNHNEKSCIFPFDKKAVHKDKDYARQALATYEQYLKSRSDDDHIRWLYNIMHMAVGTYPDKVPKKYFIDKSLFDSEIKFPNFKDIAGDLGIQSEESFGGVAIDDFNNDGFLDIIIGSLNPCDGLRFYVNDGTGNFKNMSKESGLSAQLGVGNIYQADFNNDGLLDIYLTRGAWHPGGPSDPRLQNTKGKFMTFINSLLGNDGGNNFYNTLLENKGNGKFEEVTKKVGLRTIPNSNLASSWSDFNNDGWIDLFVCNEFRKPDLFVNNKGHFTEVSDKAKIYNDGICKGTVWGDINNDLYPDLFLSNYYGDKILYVNNKDGTFSRSNQPELKDKPLYAFTTMFLDFNNDGWLDLFVEAFPPNTDNFIAAALAKPHQGEPSRLFKNKGDGTFTDVTEKVGLTAVTSGMSANFGDIDNDGYSEIFLGTGANGLGDLMPNLMFKNIDGQYYEDISVAGGFSNLQKGHGISFADLDNDGQTDVFIQLGGSSLADRFYPSLYHNPGNKNNWIRILLEGTKSNRAAIGAKIKITTDKDKNIFHTVSSGGSFGSNSLRANIGLGLTKIVKNISISWPSGESTILKNIKPNQFLKIVEGQTSPRILDIKKVDFNLTHKRLHRHD